MATNSSRFSQVLNNLSRMSRVSLLNVADQFGEKGFAALTLLLMAVPALPLPTGGITHVFEVVAMLLSLELIAGRRTVWLPQRWLTYRLPTASIKKLANLVGRLERFSRPRLRLLTSSHAASRLIGLIFLVLELFAFLAPPFSGLDTLPSLGVVLIALAVMLEDVVVAIAGLIVGSAGIVLVFLLGRLVIKLF